MASSTTNARDLEQIVRDGLSTLVFAFGFKTGIVDAFTEIQQPCTAKELSEKAGKKLRYTQEWLGCMVAAGIVTITDDENYSLPHDKTQLKIWGHNAAAIPILSEMIPKLEEATKLDGPKGYGYYEPVLHWIDVYRSSEALQDWNQRLLLPVIGIVKGNAFAILDIGCGFGKHSREVAKLYPCSKITAIDMDQFSIDNAKKELTKSGLKNIEYICLKGGQLPDEWANKFDFVIINDVLHDSYEVDEILEGIKRVLKPDGFAAAYDPAVSSYHKKVINDATAQYFLPFSLFQCLPVSSMGPNEGLGIGWGYERRKQKIKEHGFRVVQVGDKDIDAIQEGIVFQNV
ncbi:S-adenosylmethionine-dependent methyltransferase Rv2258c-like [Magallana gigas]|uniref:S-adenosylmethionine-dependent methyltransferase Rv2258c-like n=1 Tax=Magallana gigas TaxID=29159 RepID=UPI00333FFA3B